MERTIVHDDCLRFVSDMGTNSVDLVFGSPPYEDARSYDMDFRLSGREWVDWMADICWDAARVCKGLCAFVVHGRTRRFQYSCTPAMLVLELHDRGLCVRDNLYYYRKGIPGSGGPDWLRHDVEMIVCFTRDRRRLPWSDNTAMGGPCKYGPGGDMSHRTVDGSRVRPKRTTSGYRGGDTVVEARYVPPERANPGNLIHCKVGKGHMGHDLAHENEAPFPETLAEFMIRTFCPPGGVVLDPFAGSGTTAAAAERLGRGWIAVDNRESQIDIIHRRLRHVARDGSEFRCVRQADREAAQGVSFCV